jgi:hypothetical protein
MISRERELLEKVISGDNKGDFFVSYDLYKEIYEFLAQPEQSNEPVAWMNDSGGCFLSDGNKYSENWTALYTSPPKQPESTAEAIMPNGVCISNVYAAYEEGRKSAMSEREPLTNEQKIAEAALEQALKDTVDEERIRQIFINCISFN